jgi:hypothetical protein
LYHQFIISLLRIYDINHPFTVIADQFLPNGLPAIVDGMIQWFFLRQDKLTRKKRSQQKKSSDHHLLIKNVTTTFIG